MANSSKSESPANTERWKIYGGVFLIAALAYLVLVHWWFTAPMISMGEQIDQLRDQELQYRMDASQRPALEKKLNEVRQQQALTTCSRRCTRAALANSLLASGKKCGVSACC